MIVKSNPKVLKEVFIGNIVLLALGIFNGYALVVEEDKLLKSIFFIVSVYLILTSSFCLYDLWRNKRREKNGGGILKFETDGFTYYDTKKISPIFFSWDNIKKIQVSDDSTAIVIEVYNEEILEEYNMDCGRIKKKNGQIRKGKLPTNECIIMDYLTIQDMNSIVERVRKRMDLEISTKHGECEDKKIDDQTIVLKANRREILYSVIKSVVFVVWACVIVFLPIFRENIITNVASIVWAIILLWMTFKKIYQIVEVLVLKKKGLYTIAIQPNGIELNFIRLKEPIFISWTSISNIEVSHRNNQIKIEVYNMELLAEYHRKYRSNANTELKLFLLQPREELICIVKTVREQRYMRGI